MADPENKLLRILMIESDPEVFDLAAFFIESEFGVRPIGVKTDAEAKTVLDANPNFDIIISEHLPPAINAGKILQLIQATKLPIKLILLSEKEPGTIQEFRLAKPDGYAQKPLFTEGLKRAILQIQAANSTAAQSPAEPLDPYVSIAVEHLFRSGNVPYPLYARLSDQKFVKVINENDFFGAEELDRFRKKKISHLFIQRDHAKAFIQKQIQVYSALVQNNTFKSDERITLGDEIASAVHDLASNFGFSEELENITKTGVDLALKTIATNPSLSSLLKNLNLSSGNYLAVHSSRLPFIANHITRLMEWDSEGTAYKMALASMLHDSTLNVETHTKFEQDLKLLPTAKAKMTKKEYEEFIQHPIKAAEITARFKGIPPDVDNIIAQHHEACDGSGFPQKINYSRISPLSSAFIVAHDLLRYYEEAGVSFSIEDFIALKQEEYFAGFFKKILLELAMLKMQ